MRVDAECNRTPETGPSPPGAADGDWSAFDLLPTGVSLWDRELRCRYANHLAAHWLGASGAHQITGRAMPELLGEAYLRHARAALTGTPAQFQHTDDDAVGRTRHRQVTCSPWVVNGQVRGVLLSLTDITASVEHEQQRLQEELAEALETFELSFGAAPIGKALVAADGRWLKVNRALSVITGRSEAELLSGSFQDITHPDDLDPNLVGAAEMLRGDRAGYETEKRYLCPDGRVVWVQLSVAAARRRDGTFRFFVVQVQDITRRRSDAQALQHRADHDPLTGLWNRRRFTEELRACYRGRRATDRPVLLLMDLDDFKAVNDRHGHLAGDEHLRHVAAALQAALRAGDACARLGGDEFAVLLADADADTAAEITARIAARIAALGHGSASIGAAAWPAHRSIDDWLKQADQAMYRAKAGRPHRTRAAVHRAGRHPAPPGVPARV